MSSCSQVCPEYVQETTRKLQLAVRQLHGDSLASGFVESVNKVGVKATPKSLGPRMSARILNTFGYLTPYSYEDFVLCLPGAFLSVINGDDESVLETLVGFCDDGAHHLATDDLLNSVEELLLFLLRRMHDALRVHHCHVIGAEDLVDFLHASWRSETFRKMAEDYIQKVISNDTVLDALACLELARSSKTASQRWPLAQMSRSLKKNWQSLCEPMFLESRTNVLIEEDVYSSAQLAGYLSGIRGDLHPGASK